MTTVGKWVGGVLIIGLFLTAPAALQAQPSAAVRQGGADFTGVEQFLELTALLERDQEPTMAQWDRLFATPGYAVLTKSEFRRDGFIERFRLAFMPSRKGDLEGQLQAQPKPVVQILQHYVQAKARRAEIEQRVAELRKMDVHASAIARAQKLLPAGTMTGSPSVAFVIFAPDARGYDPVVIDVLFSISQRETFTDFVAHEFHHWYRNRLLQLDQDRDTLWAVNQIHAEGLADLIDRADLPKKSLAELSPRERSYREFYDKTPETIATLDALLSRMAGMKTGRAAAGAELARSVPQSGHPTGLFMATLIVEELGREVLIRSVTNPFEFFRLYNQAAAKRGAGMPRFSAAALAFLGAMEQRFLG